MKRELIEKNDAGMAVVDTTHDLFMQPIFIAGVIKTEMRPTIICHTLGRFKTRREAIDAAVSALTQQERAQP